ncbi:DoxX family protein [Rufibacter soli]|jgi:putative oxidoreductase
MKFTNKVEKWQHKHHPVLYDYGRIALGGFLLFKGASFLFNITPLVQILLDSRLYSVATYLAYFIALVHVIGGAMMMVGWHTRWASIAQIPIVLSALIFFTPAHDLYSIYSPFAVTVYTLLLLVFYAVGGSGFYSFDHRFFIHERKEHKMKKSHVLDRNLHHS